MDLRHLAVILDKTRDKANEWAGPGDAALISALDTAAEMATWYALHPDGGTLFPIEQEFEKLADRLR